MPTIDQASLNIIGDNLFAITALCHQRDIDMPWLAQANSWYMQQKGLTGFAGVSATGAPATINDQVVLKMAEFPQGISGKNLGNELTKAGINVPNIGPTLANLQRSRLVHKTGDLWFAGTGPGVGSLSTQRRKTNASRARKPAAAEDTSTQRQTAAAE